MDKTGNLITELICKGRMKHTDLERLFTGRIEDEANLCTDSNKSQFAWLEIFHTEKDTIKSKNLLDQSHTSHTDTKRKDFRIREAIYV